MDGMFWEVGRSWWYGCNYPVWETIVVSQREPQKVFKLLDMFEGLENLKDDVENVSEGYGCM